MENDTFDELKEFVSRCRRKKCMVKTKNQGETKIWWNAIWNEVDVENSKRENNSFKQEIMLLQKF